MLVPVLVSSSCGRNSLGFGLSLTTIEAELELGSTKVEGGEDKTLLGHTVSVSGIMSAGDYGDMIGKSVLVDSVFLAVSLVITLVPTDLLDDCTIPVTNNTEPSSFSTGADIVAMKSPILE